MIYMFLAPGFEETEAITPLDILRRAGADIKTVSVSNSPAVIGSHQITLNADLTADEYKSYLGTPDGIILPGGMPGTMNLWNSEFVKRTVLDANDHGSLIGAICAAPLILGRLGILNGRRAVCYPGHEAELTGADVLTLPSVRDGNIITARGAGAAVDFALELVRYLYGGEKAESLAKSIIYK